MKRFYLLIFTTISISVGHAQDIMDGLRYSTESNLGSARFTGLSGAMGALGGDFSAMSKNPAGGAVFLLPNFTISGAYTDMENVATYFNNSERRFENNININQAGGVFIFQDFGEESKLRKITLGINYQMTNDFYSSVFLAGTGNNTIADFFLSHAQGIPLSNLETMPGESISNLYQYLGETSGSGAQNAFLGFQGYLFDPVDADDPRNTAYVSNVAGDRFDHQYLMLTKGSKDKFTINVAAQITDDFYFGANINTYSLDFRKQDLFVETNAHPESLVNGIGFENNLKAYGDGMSVQLGGIARLANNFRLGLSVDSPTWFRITEETSQYLETRVNTDGRNRIVVVDPRTINIYEDYTLRTPGMVTASAAYIFNQNGLISLDYSYKDYSNMKFSPGNDSYFSALNRSIESTLKGASILRAGGEYRINAISLRGGFHFEESPYKNDDTWGDLMGFSLGTGYNFGNFNIDLAYSRSEQKRDVPLYGAAFDGQARTNSIYSDFILSFNFIW